MPGAAWAAAVWLVACMARDSSEALTTFGKTNPANTLPAKPTPPPGRECSKETECAGIQGTSCVRDPDDLKLRCLCGDNKGPLNGRCEAKHKGLRHYCLQTSECLENMICAVPNATSKAGQHRGVQVSPTTKMCICNEEAGFVDREFECSDGVMHNSISLAIMLGAIVSWLRREHLI